MNYLYPIRQQTAQCNMNVNKDCCLLGYDTMFSGANLQMFHRNLLLPSSGWETVAAHVSEISAN